VERVRDEGEASREGAADDLPDREKEVESDRAEKPSIARGGIDVGVMVTMPPRFLR